MAGERSRAAGAAIAIGSVAALLHAPVICWLLRTGDAEADGADPTRTARAPSASSSPPSASSAAAADVGRGAIAGVVTLAGRPPEMKVPSKRALAEVCRDEAMVHDGVRGEPGKLRDVLVRLPPGSVASAPAAPSEPVRIDQKACVYLPRIQGAVAGQVLEVHNGDATLHNVHAYELTDTWFNQAHPKGAPPIRRELTDAGIFRLACDVHPWMRAFVVVTDHPHFARTGDDGSFEIRGVPAGLHTVEAWHSLLGWKRISGVEVRADSTATAVVSFDASDPAPPENPSELRDLW